MARRLGPDIPAFAEAYFSPRELQALNKLDLGLWRPVSKSRHWVDTTPSVVEHYLRVVSADNPHRPLLEKLARGLEEASEQRGVRTVEALGERLFAPERATARLLPLDEAFALVEGFSRGALGAHLELLSHGLMSELGRAPGRFIPHAPPKLETPADLAVALWGENRIHDHVDLTSKVTHLHHVTKGLSDYGFLVSVQKRRCHSRTQSGSSGDSSRNTIPSGFTARLDL